MFSLHETTKIHACRVAFITFCVLPTCAVLVWCCAVRLPTYRRAHERAIAAELGWHVQLGSVSNSKPGTILYKQLDLFDAETRQLLAHLPFVEVETSGQTVTVRLPFPSKINGTRLDAIEQLILAQVRESHAWQQLNIEAGNLTLHLGDGPQTLTEVHGQIQDMREKSSLTLNFRRAIAGEELAPESQLTVTRQRTAKTPASEIHFVTGGAPLPCSLAASLVPGVSGMGKLCAFDGEISVIQNPLGWAADIKGQLIDVDLDGLVRGRFQHRLSGTAQVRLDGARARDGRLQSASGHLIAGPGMISRSLIHAAQSNLYLNAATAAVTGSGNVLPYEQLSLAFEVDATGLVVRGDAAQEPGAILVGQNGVVLMSQGTVNRHPALDLLRTLVPNVELQVPAALETDWLSHVLPVPSVRPPLGGETPLPQAKRLDVKRR